MILWLFLMCRASLRISWIWTSESPRQMPSCTTSAVLNSYLVRFPWHTDTEDTRLNLLAKKTQIKHTALKHIIHHFSKNVLCATGYCVELFNVNEADDKLVNNKVSWMWISPQFGYWSGQLGDGRAHLLGQYTNRWVLLHKTEAKT